MFANSDDFPMMMELEAGLDSRLHSPVSVGFGMYPLIDHQKTKEAGHEVYSDVEFVKIAVPGDKCSLYFQPATDKHKQRFPKSYEAFKARAVEGKTGLPLEQWAGISRSMVLTFKAMHIHTVEDLAAVHDGHVDKLGQIGRELRAKAQAFLDQAKDSAAAQRLVAEKAELERQLQAMQAQINALQTSASGQKPEPAPQVDAREAAAAAAARKPRRKAA